jgi:hypothetical protein
MKHLLEHGPCRTVWVEKVELRKRKIGRCKVSDHLLRHVPESCGSWVAHDFGPGPPRAPVSMRVRTSSNDR